MKKQLLLYSIIIIFVWLVSLLAVSFFVTNGTYLYLSLPVLLVLLLVFTLACLSMIRVMAKRMEMPIALFEQNKLAYILNSIGDGLFVVDENNNITLANAAALSIFDASTDIIGKKLNHVTNKKKLLEAVVDCTIHSKDALLELNLRGSTFLITVRRLPGTNLTMSVLADVTENRQNAKRREEFFTNASHELKTPLTAIKGFNELMSLNNDNINNQKYIDGITRETNRLMTLITGMLKLSEMENAQTVEPVRVQLSEVISDVCEAMSTVISEKSISFETRGDTTVLADPGHIYDLIKNLVENAVKYNKHGGKVTVVVENRKKKPALLTVSDNGIGVSPKHQARIFERFYRVDKSRAVWRGGTGLGLSIVKHICSLYGWKLSLKSKPDVGTDVTVEFVNM